MAAAIGGALSTDAVGARHGMAREGTDRWPELELERIAPAVSWRAISWIDRWNRALRPQYVGTSPCGRRPGVGQIDDR
jgi:hypothetical protein